MSSAAALCVTHPTEIRSTPVAAIAGAVAAVMRPDASVITFPPAMPTAFLRSSTVMLSSRTASTPSESACSSCVDLDLDLDEVTGMRLRAFDGGADAAGKRNVVVLDQNRIIEPEAVIAAAAGADRVFFQRPKSGRGLAGADDLRPRSLHGRYQRGCCRRNAAQMAEKIKGRSLAGEQTARGPIDFSDDISGRDRAAVRPLSPERDGGGERLKRTARDVEPGDNARLACP